MAHTNFKALTYCTEGCRANWIIWFAQKQKNLNNLLELTTSLKREKAGTGQTIPPVSTIPFKHICI